MLVKLRIEYQHPDLDDVSYQGKYLNDLFAKVLLDLSQDIPLYNLSEFLAAFNDITMRLDDGETEVVCCRSTMDGEGFTLYCQIEDYR